MAKNKTFEESIEELENIVKTLEDGECSLEDAVKLFEKGVKLSNDCHKVLDEAEQKIKILTESGPESGTEEEE